MKFIDLKKALLFLIPLVIIVGGGLWLSRKFERHAPTIQLVLGSDAVGNRPFEVQIHDKGTGLRSVAITLVRAGTVVPILAEEYASGTMEKKLTVGLSREKLRLKDGPAALRVAARDGSYWNFFDGNETVVGREIRLDFTPPRIDLVSGDRYVSFGGSGLVIYRTSPDSTKSGVRIGGYFFPGYKAGPDTPDSHLAFFAHPYDVPREEKAFIVAEDAAGNLREAALSYTLKEVRYRKRRVEVTDNYIQSKMAPLLDGGTHEGLKDVFLQVNHKLRRENEAEIRRICERSIDRMLWTGAFHQLSNSKVEGNFADERTYVYRGEVIDHAYHLGYDLAVTRNYPVEAANNGVVVFAGDLGIYGGTVILDHGLGIFTMYNHMSSIGVEKGQEIERKQIVGKTGETGLATGDHLHYATLVHGVPVLPLEWWDRKWVNDNILARLPKPAESPLTQGQAEVPR